MPVRLLSSRLQDSDAFSPDAPLNCSRNSSVRRSSQNVSASRSRSAVTKSRTVCSASSWSLPPQPARTASRQISAAVRNTGGLVSAGIELEDDPGDLHVVARLEARGLERLDHAERAQPLLHVAERLVVVDVVTRDQPLDPLALDPESARPGAAHAVGLAAARAVDPVRGRRLRGLLAALLRRDVPEDRARELLEALARRRGGREHLDAEALAPVLDGLLGLLGRHEVRLRQRQHARQAGEAVPVLAKLGLHGVEVLGRIGAVERLEVEDVHQQPAALHVREELVTEPRAGAGALDEAGDVGDDELAIVPLERAQHRLDGGEGIVGDLRLRAGEPRQERRLAGVRQPYEARIGGELEVQLDRALLAREAALREAGALACGGRELLVAAPAAAAAGHDRAVAGVQHVPAVAGLGVLDDGAGRNADLEQLGRGAVPVRALAVAAALRLEVGAAAEAGEVAQGRVHHDRDVAAVAAVAAVRAAPRYVRLAAEGDHAVPAGSASHVNPRAIVEHGYPARGGPGEAGGPGGTGAEGSTPAGSETALVPASRAISSLSSGNRPASGSRFSSSIQPACAWKARRRIGAASFSRPFAASATPCQKASSRLSGCERCAASYSASAPSTSPAMASWSPASARP